MKQIPVKLGPLALLLTVIAICMTTLALLTFTTARADASLAEKYADTVKTRYELEVEGREFVAGLSDDPESAEGVIEKTFEKNGSLLHVSVEFDGEGNYRVLSWRHEKRWVENEEIGNLWDGD